MQIFHPSLSRHKRTGMLGAYAAKGRTFSFDSIQTCSKSLGLLFEENGDKFQPCNINCGLTELNRFRLP